jgi:hypothetical protein
MGKFNSTADAIPQKESLFFPGPVFSTPAYVNGTVYYGAVRDHIKAFALKAQFPTGPASKTAEVFFYPGANAEHFRERHERCDLGGRRATDLSNELYNSNQAPFVQDQLGPGNKYSHNRQWTRVRGDDLWGGGLRLALVDIP